MVVTVSEYKVSPVSWSAEQLTEVFKRFDANRDGKLSKDEVREAFKYLGSRASYFRTLKAYQNADLNNDGNIDLQDAEFSVLVKYVQNLACNVPIVHNKTADKASWTKDQLKDALRSHDLNGDGKLSKGEITKAFERFGSNWTAYRAWRALSHADTDKSGYINLSDQELQIWQLMFISKAI